MTTATAKDVSYGNSMQFDEVFETSIFYHAKILPFHEKNTIFFAENEIFRKKLAKSSCISRRSAI
jgi:hypothetical protein